MDNYISGLKEGMDENFSGIAEYMTGDFVEKACLLMWYYAKKKPFEVQKFEDAQVDFQVYTSRLFVDGKMATYDRAVELCDDNAHYVVISEHVEWLLALIYANNQLGGVNAVKQKEDIIDAWIQTKLDLKYQDECFILASGLAWMELYGMERDLLRTLVAAKVQLPEDLQDRLNFLESGGNANIKVYDVVQEKEFLFDNSSVDWKMEEYNMFFRQAAMKKVEFQYSLAVSKWTKTLPLASGQKVSQDKLKEEFAKMVEDFDGEVTCEQTEARAVNLSNVEYEDATLFRFHSNRNRCVSVLFYSEKYGRNLNLTIITLFTPEAGVELEELKNYALAIKDNIYVESFRESILQAVDEVIKEKTAVYEETPDTPKVFF